MHKTTIGLIILLLIAISITQSSYPVSSLTTTTPQSIGTDVTTIQETINQAKPGSTIQLSAGTYTEVFTINKPLHIKGESATNTRISATSSPNGYAIHITSEGVTLSNLDISNQGAGLYTTGVKITASQTTIQGCMFHDTPIGIAVWSSHNIISQCEFLRCSDEGIVLLGAIGSDCTHNTISSCVFTENCDGIELQYASYNTIEACTFVQNTHAGIDAIESHNNNNIITQSEFTDNQGYGLYLAGSSKNQITHCSFTDSSIILVKASDNTIADSTVSTIHLRDESSLLIDQCKNVDPSAIRSQHSTYEIRTEQTNNVGIRHPLLQTMLSRFPLLKTLYEKFYQ